MALGAKRAEPHKTIHHSPWICRVHDVCCYSDTWLRTNPRTYRQTSDMHHSPDRVDSTDLPGKAEHVVTSFPHSPPQRGPRLAHLQAKHQSLLSSHPVPDGCWAGAGGAGQTAIRSQHGKHGAAVWQEQSLMLRVTRAWILRCKIMKSLPP